MSLFIVFERLIGGKFLFNLRFLGIVNYNLCDFWRDFEGVIWNFVFIFDGLFVGVNDFWG